MKHPKSQRPLKWEPSPAEVRDIVSQFRPVLCRMAAIDRKKVAAEILRRRNQHEPVHA